jgi:Acetoacetate decarboxylase (ADC)
MNAMNPFSAINLHGEGRMRSLTLALPTDRVRNLLPAGLELGEQAVTPPGTHPVVMLFNDLFRAQMSIPTLLPSLTYHEHTMGVPFAYVTRGGITAHSPGPYYFMPLLFLDSFLAVLGGVSIWGFAKRLASFQVTADRYTFSSTGGQRYASLTWKATGVHRPVRDYDQFEPIRQLLNQPLISMLPGSLGPFFTISDFEKQWDAATIQPLATALEIDLEYVTGFPGGRYPARGTSPGIDETVLGSYELLTPWRLSLPYPPLARG